MNQKKTNNSKSDIVSIILMIVGIALIVFALWKLIPVLKNDADSKHEYQQMRQEYTESTSQTSEPKEWWQLCDVDLESLQKKNPDVAAWIYFEGQPEVSYPVMWTKTENKYLRRNIDGKYSIAGCIFIEPKNKPDFSDGDTILYGHRMRNKTMFGSLKYYFDDPNYYEGNQYVQIIQNDTISRYRIFAFEQIQPSSDLYSIHQKGTDDYQNWIDKIKSNSRVDTSQDITVTNQDSVIMLSTCTRNGKQRHTVYAVKVDEHTR